jgi:hypothetical protein
LEAHRVCVRQALGDALRQEVLEITEKYLDWAGPEVTAQGLAGAVRPAKDIRDAILQIHRAVFEVKEQLKGARAFGRATGENLGARANEGPGGSRPASLGQERYILTNQRLMSHRPLPRWSGSCRLACPNPFGGLTLRGRIRSPTSRYQVRLRLPDIGASRDRSE